MCILGQIAVVVKTDCAGLAGFVPSTLDIGGCLYRFGDDQAALAPRDSQYIAGLEHMVKVEDDA